MEQKINIAELLKDCPTGMELDCTIYENVTLVQVKEGYDYPIVIETPNGQMLLSKYGCFSKNELAKCVIFPKGKTTWEGFVPPCEFKDGDIVATTNGLFVGIVEVKNNKPVGAYCSIDYAKDFRINNDYVFDRLATTWEKEKLFQAIKDNGYHWNPETKTLEKLSKFKVGDRVKKKDSNEDVVLITDIADNYYIVETKYGMEVTISISIQNDYELVPNKFDIANLKPFDKVLVRDNNEQFWTCDWFSFHDTKQVYPFACVGHYVSQCIPYEGNQHLLSTTNDCSDYYKNW